LKIWVAINLTPDSFFADSRLAYSEVIQQVTKYIELNVDKIDIGAESSRPGAKAISVEEEWARISPVLLSIQNEFGVDFLRERISIDTRKKSNIKRCLELGVGTINDISGGSEEIFSMISFYEATYVLMHMSGIPENMQTKPSYKNVVHEVEDWLSQKSERLINKGVKKEKIIWDPGIGFGKSLEHNISLIKNTQRLKSQGHELLYGISRKSMFKDLLSLNNPEDRLLASIVGQVILFMQGVEHLRVHDASEMVQAREILKRFT
jgi:dihydropteroate synthase